MPWLQITFTIDQGRAALFEAALENAGALAVTFGDAGDDPQLEPPPGAMPLWQAVRLVALFEDGVDAQTIADGLAPHSLTPPLIEIVADRPWERVWLDDFRPTCFGRRLWICPQGQPAGAPDAIVVDLDPGLAFGTGHHPTTALCLEWLDGDDLVGKTVLDYGCGSGILAIAARKLGAARVIAVDHDPQAIEATLSNAAANAVNVGLSVCLPTELATVLTAPPVDVVIANILSGPLIELAPLLMDRLRAGGDLVLSGVLEDQVPGVTTAYGSCVDFAPVRLREGWALITGRKRAARHPCA